MNLLNEIKNMKHRVFSKRGAITLDPRLAIGAYSYGITMDTVFWVKDSDRVSIGSYCSFAPEVKIFPSGEHNFKAVSTFPFYANILGRGAERDTLTRGPVVIGNDVWVGFRSMIFSGVTIGDGAVVAAGAVVTQNVPPYAGARGVPAKIMGYRFSPEMIQALLEIKWWNWDIDKIHSHLDDFYLDVHEFVKKHRRETHGHQK